MKDRDWKTEEKKLLEKTISGRTSPLLMILERNLMAEEVLGSLDVGSLETTCRAGRYIDRHPAVAIVVRFHQRVAVSITPVALRFLLADRWLHPLLRTFAKTRQTMVR